MSCAAFRSCGELLRGGAEEEIRRQFPGGARVYWHLHPPFLRALGMKRKLRLGRWARPALSLLRALRRLRGTAVDPFGPSEVRRVERALIEEYRAMVLRALEMPSLHDAAVAIAELPDLVRGYEAIKLRNVQRFHERAAALGGQTWTRNQTITARRSK